SANEHEHIIKEYIDSELAQGYFSGPFSQEELESKISPFHSLPLQVAFKDGTPGDPPKFDVCHNLS
ncbi:uncharacterized protein BJ212DRAFT_1252078, partial [Suillus subaureus]